MVEVMKETLSIDIPDQRLMLTLQLEFLMRLLGYYRRIRLNEEPSEKGHVRDKTDRYSPYIWERKYEVEDREKYGIPPEGTNYGENQDGGGTGQGL